MSETVLVSTAQNPLQRIFSRDALLFAFAVAVLPNILFLLAAPCYIAERLVSPMLYLAAGLGAIFVPRWLALCLFALAAAIDLALIIMMAFHLPLDVAMDSIQYMMSIDVTASLFYMALAGTVTATTLAAAFFVSARRERLRLASPVPAAVMAGLITWADWTYTFPYFQKPEIPFDSALDQSGLNAPAVLAQRKNLLVVMVEGLGAYSNPKHRELFKEALRKGLPKGRFALEDGATHYRGSTTGAASRELCGQWGDYLTYLGTGQHECLPRKLARSGYETISFHGFTHQMFKRDRWYPEIGFAELNFAEDLLDKNASRLKERCGSVFVGLCDTQLAPIVGERLTQDPGKAKLVYWLTLNTHIPYVAKSPSGLGCGSGQAAIENRTVCELTDLWLDVFGSINQIAARKDLPPTDILVVGDHHTPLWERDAKSHFVLGKVDWYLLRDQRKNLLPSSGS